MKIVHIIFSMNIGGSESMLIDILHEQAKDHDVELFVINKDYNAELLHKIRPVVKTRLFNRQRGSKNILPLIYLNYHIYEFNPDILHFHDQNGIRVLFSKKRKTVLTVHDVGLDTTYLPGYTHICAISEAVKNDIFKRTGKQALLVYNGIHFEKIRKKKYQENENTFRIVQVSRLEHDKKGQDIALKAIHYIKQKRPGLNISIDFIGTGSSGNYLQQLSKELNVEKQANFLGLQTREYIYENLHTYDLLIQPSIYEGFGLTVVEGMAARIPVLVSNNDGPMEIIRQGKYGFYFEKKHVEDCAQQIMEIIDLDTQQISDSVTAAFNHASQNFDIRQTVRKYLEIYSE